MRAVCTAAEARALDEAVIVGQGVPGIALMEVASQALADAVRRHHAAEAARGVVCVCGPGNNGGDGYGAARWLRAWGIPVSTWSLGGASRGDAAVMRAAAAAAGVPEVEGIGRAGVIVDAVFGTGLDRPVTGAAAEALVRMDTHPAPVVAADLPSGLDADTGAVLGVAVQAARTVTFGAYKRGLLCGAGPALAGVVHVAELGWPLREAPPDAELPEAADLAPLWPRRAPGDHKGRAGHLLVIAGSTAMAGAAVLTALGALAGGVGLVTLITSRGALSRLGALPPEVMVIVAGDRDHVELHRLPPMDRFTAIAAGPGLGGGEPLPPHTEMALAGLWAGAPQGAVFDADALVAVQGRPAAPRLITPHAREAARLLGITAGEVEADRFAAARRLADQGGVALLKGPHTLVAGPGPVSVNPTGCAVLATGGAGDVLTGLCGALLARGCAPRDAARLGAWAHGRAADALGARRSEGWTASELARALPEAIAGTA